MLCLENFIPFLRKVSDQLYIFYHSKFIYSRVNFVLTHPFINLHVFFVQLNKPLST